MQLCITMQFMANFYQSRLALKKLASALYFYVDQYEILYKLVTIVAFKIDGHNNLTRTVIIEGHYVSNIKHLQTKYVVYRPTHPTMTQAQYSL